MKGENPLLESHPRSPRGVPLSTSIHAQIPNKCKTLKRKLFKGEIMGNLTKRVKSNSRSWAGSFLSTWVKVELPVEGTSTEDLSLSCWPMDMSVGSFSQLMTAR